MHIFFSGIGGAGIGSLALIAKQSGYDVSGSDKQESDYLDNLRAKGITSIYVGQAKEKLENVHADKPIDWFVYSSAVEKENSNHPELVFAKENDIKFSKRDEFLNMLIQDNKQKLIAIAGTHGKTTTTAMCIWLFKQLNIPISYSVGAKLSFGESGEFDPHSEYFVYEADEYDRNFLSFQPEIALITGVDWDHPDIYPTREEYYEAFRSFIAKSTYTIGHPDDLQKLAIDATWEVFSPDEKINKNSINLTGEVNRMNALLVIQALAELAPDKNYDDLIQIINTFPGVSRRFEKIADNIYSDYAHTPAKIRGAIQLAKEVSPRVVVVYEGLHNTRQHFIKEELETLFTDANKLYIVPSYLAREDENLELLKPEKLSEIIKKPDIREPAALNDDLKFRIQSHADSGDLVLCLTAGGGNSLDEWLRKEFAS